MLVSIDEYSIDNDNNPDNGYPVYPIIGKDRKDYNNRIKLYKNIL